MRRKYILIPNAAFETHLFDTLTKNNNCLNKHMIHINVASGRIYK